MEVRHASVGSRADPSAGGEGPAIAVMVAIGSCWALAPRMGWKFSLSASWQILSAVSVTLAVLGLTVWWTWKTSEASEKCKAQEEASEKCSAQEDRHREEVAMEEESEEEELDPLWETDWTNAEERGAVAKHILEAEAPWEAEVFELNDTPTWLARLQQRRGQAKRAGKIKLVQKIEKEIIDAQKAQKGSPPKRGKNLSDSPSHDRAQMPEEDNVWNMDWSNFAHREQVLPTIAVA